VTSSRHVTSSLSSVTSSRTRARLCRVPMRELASVQAGTTTAVPASQASLASVVVVVVVVVVVIAFVVVVALVVVVASLASVARRSSARRTTV